MVQATSFPIDHHGAPKQTCGPNKLHTPGIEPGAQAWKACMLPLHYECHAMCLQRQGGRKHGAATQCESPVCDNVIRYTWPGSNWRPSACEADVIATRPQVRCLSDRWNDLVATYHTTRPSPASPISHRQAAKGASRSLTCTCGLVAMTSAQHAEGRQFDPGQV